MQRVSLLSLCFAVVACGKADEKKAATTATTTTVPAETTTTVPVTTVPATASGSSSGSDSGSASSADVPALTDAQLADAATYVTFSYESNDDALCRSFKLFPATKKAECTGADFATTIDVAADAAGPLLDALKDLVIHEFAACPDNGAAEYYPHFSINGGDALSVGDYDAKAGWTCQNGKPHGVIAKTPPLERTIPFIALLEGAFKTALAAAKNEHPLLTQDKLTDDATVVTYSFESNGVPTCDWYNYKPKSGAATCGLFPNTDSLKSKTVAGADKTALDAALLDLSVRAVESCPDNGAREFFPHLTYKGDKVDVGTYASGAWTCTSGDNEQILISRTAPAGGTEPAFIKLLKAQVD